MRERILLILIVVFLGLFVTNLVFLDVNWLRGKSVQEVGSSLSSLVSEPKPTLIPQTSASPVAFADTCGSICQQTIDQKVSEAMATLSGQEKTVYQKTTETVSQPTVIYVPLGGGGSTTSRDWADVGNAEIYLNVNDYSNLDRAYFEAFVRVKHGNGRVFVRLYDVTHSVGVQGGEAYTNNEDFTLVESGSLSFWQGKNLYRVQIKSLNGYEAFYDSGRIKLILK